MRQRAAVGSGQAPPAEPDLISLTIREIKCLLAAALHQPRPADHAARWLQWRRRSRRIHQRARLAHDFTLVT